MSRQFEKLLKAHEREDSEYVCDAESVMSRVVDEFENSEEIINLIKCDPDFANTFFDYSLTPERWPVIPVRKSDRLYVKKHTSSQRPYFHDHTFYELIYVCKGKCVQEFADSGRVLTLCKNQACIVTPGTVHSLKRCLKGDIILKCVIPSVLLDDGVFNELHVKNQVFVFDETNDSAQYAFQSFVCECCKTDGYSAFAAKNLVQLFVLGLLRGNTRVHSHICDLLVDYLGVSLASANLRNFAKTIGYSCGYLGRQIKRESGKSFSEYLEDFRLQKAKDMLKDSDLSVENIASQLGFANTSGFYKQFSRSLGLTPSEFRKAHRQVRLGE